MDVRKTRELRFTYQDAAGALRVVHVQAAHLVDRGKDRVRLQVTHDGAAPVELLEFVDEALARRVVKTDTLP